MVSPEGFAANPQTQVDNHFMRRGAAAVSLPQVQKEFQEYAQALRRFGVRVVMHSNPIEEGTPDAIFPNNWFSTHRVAGGHQPCMFLYPMKAENRRLERKPRIIQELRKEYPRVVDLSGWEEKGEYLEGTGSMIFSFQHGEVYLMASERSSATVAQQVVQHLSALAGRPFRLIPCTSYDPGKPIYHTNVMLSIGSRLAILCTDAMAPGPQRDLLLQHLSAHHEILEISLSQMNSFCGNVLELCGEGGHLGLAMSTRSLDSFDAPQLHLLERHYGKHLIASPLDTIEEVGGGGARCLLAELF